MAKNSLKVQIDRNVQKNGQNGQGSENGENGQNCQK